MAENTVLITNVVGKAYFINSEDDKVQIQSGMRIPEGAQIITANDAAVTLQADGVPPVIVGENNNLLVTQELAQANPQPTENVVTTPAEPTGDSLADQVLAALESGEDPFDILDPTAAVLTGGEGGGASFSLVAS